MSGLQVSAVPFQLDPRSDPGAFRDGFRIVLGVSLGLALAATVELYAYARKTRLLEVSNGWRAGLLGFTIACVGLAIALRITRLPLGLGLAEGSRRLVESMPRLGFSRYVLLALLAIGFPVAVMGPWGRFLPGFSPRLLVFWVFALAASILVRSLRPGWRWRTTLLATGLVLGGVHRLASFLPELSADPFSLGWSEASRYYYASLFFADRLYGVDVLPSVLHPSRYLLQSFAFLIPGAPIWVHRAWQVFLWLGTAGAAGWLLAKRLSIRDGRHRALFAIWVALFFFQGPVYYHLLVMVVAIVWGFQADHPGRTAVVVILASVWAGLSRVNWFPVPGLLAAEMYFLERPVDPRSAWRWMLSPFLWVVGGSAVAIMAQRGYVNLSGNPADSFTTSFTSDLLWYRLWPNATNQLGVLPAIVLVSAPAWLWIGIAGWIRRGSIRPLRVFAVASILLVLFAGGLVVSVKIGGGSNLHNLDAYLVALAILAGYVAWDRVPPDRPIQPEPGRVPWNLQAAAALLPLFLLVSAGAPVQRPEPAAQERSMQTVRELSQSVAQQGKEVLFIAQRQLLTFGFIEKVPLVPDYELVFLMEMAMAGHRPYLDEFQDDLRRQRFGLIVTYPLETEYQGRNHSFGEENDAWVKQVSEPILCFYEETRTLSAPPLQVLVPRLEPAPCPTSAP